MNFFPLKPKYGLNWAYGSSAKKLRPHNLLAQLLYFYPNCAVKTLAGGTLLTFSRTLSKGPFLVGVSLLTFSLLTFQIVQTRILSVIAWYYMAFLAISVAMLGMTVGAVWVYLAGGWWPIQAVFWLEWGEKRPDPRGRHEVP